LSRVGILCNRAEFQGNQDDVPVMQKEVNGDASESAILKCMEMSVGDVAGYRDKNKKLCEIPFNSTNKFQVSVHDADGENRCLLVMKVLTLSCVRVFHSRKAESLYKVYIFECRVLQNEFGTVVPPSLLMEVNTISTLIGQLSLKKLTWIWVAWESVF